VPVSTHLLRETYHNVTCTSQKDDILRPLRSAQSVLRPCAFGEGHVIGIRAGRYCRRCAVAERPQLRFTRPFGRRVDPTD